MATKTDTDNTIIAELDIVTTRVIDAPRARVFAAWTDPTILARWWGPKGFTNTFHRFALEPKGVWDFTMHGPDGTNYHNTSIFERIDAPEHLVFVHQKPMHRFVADVRFDEVDGGTRITWRMRFDTPAERTRVLDFIPAANEENLDKLEAELRRNDHPRNA
ncbi:MAG TPA: SRPBCC family protein [Flavobacteriales bacterium]|jgi:uncharacterized protein YndB with AHSA1/START domain|nr:SRPBCC family protein [Flavobacteriales bacterium]